VKMKIQKTKVFRHLNSYKGVGRRTTGLNKKGTHVGFIISVIIFIGFVIFLLMYLRPSVTESEEQKYLLKTTEEKIEDLASYNLMSFTIKIDDGFSYEGNAGPVNCFFIDVNDIFGDDIQGEERKKIIVKDEESAVITQYGLSSNKKSLVIYHENKKFFKIYQSEHFTAVSNINPSSSGCVEVPEENYLIGLVRNKDYIFHKGILELKDRYDSTGYGVLKTELEVPDINDFGFKLKDSAKVEIIDATKEIRGNNPVYADEKLILYVDDIADLNQGWLYVEVY